MRHCKTCKFALTSDGKPRIIETPNGTIVCQSSGNGYVCNRPGGVTGGLNINLNTDWFDCGSWEPKEGGHHET